MVLHIDKGRKDTNEHSGSSKHDNDPYIQGGIRPDVSLAARAILYGGRRPGHFVEIRSCGRNFVGVEGGLNRPNARYEAGQGRDLMAEGVRAEEGATSFLSRFAALSTREFVGCKQ